MLINQIFITTMLNNRDNIHSTLIIFDLKSKKNKVVIFPYVV